MGRRSFEKKYKVVDSFHYRGPDGKWPHEKSYIIGPGEQVPKLESHQLEKLLTEGKISELDMHGELIPNSRLVEMNAEQVNKTFEGKAESTVVRLIETTNFSKDTLARILVFCEKVRYNQASLIADQKLAA